MSLSSLVIYFKKHELVISDVIAQNSLVLGTNINIILIHYIHKYTCMYITLAALCYLVGMMLLDRLAAAGSRLKKRSRLNKK